MYVYVCVCVHLKESALTRPHTIVIGDVLGHTLSFLVLLQWGAARAAVRGARVADVPPLLDTVYGVAFLLS